MGESNKAGLVPKVDTAFAAVLTAAFVLAAGFVMLHHEMWRDEIQSWMVARDSSTIGQLVWNMRYEGHPTGWYLLLYGLTRISHSPYALQYMHLAIAAIGVYVLAAYAPMSRLWKLIYAFGFYPFYQYAIVCRGYVLCAVLLYCFCALFGQRSKRFLLLSLILFALSLADNYGWFMAISLSLTLMAAQAADAAKGIKWQNSRASVIAGSILVAAGLILCMIVTKPPADGTMHSSWHAGLEMSRLLPALYSLTFPYKVLSLGQYAALTFLVGLAFLLWFVRNSVSRAMYCSFFGILFVFYYLKLDAMYWHKGMGFIFLVGCIWIHLASHQETPLPTGLLNRASAFVDRHRTALILLPVVFFLPQGLLTARRDIRRPYSAGRDAARLITSQLPSSAMLIGDTDYAASTVAAYTGRSVYYPAVRRFGTFILFNKERYLWLPPDELVRRVREAPASHGQVSVLVMSYPLRDSVRNQLGAKLIRSFTGAMVGDENYWLYAINP